MNWFLVLSQWLFYNTVLKWSFLFIVWVCYFEVHISRLKNCWTFQSLSPCQSVLRCSCSFQVPFWRRVFYMFKFLVLLNDSEILLIDMVRRRCSGDDSLFGFTRLRSNQGTLGTFSDGLCIIMTGSEGIIGRSLLPPLSLEYKSHK